MSDDEPINAFTGERTLALMFLQMMFTSEPGYRLEDRISDRFPDLNRQQTLRYMFQIQVLLRDLLTLDAGHRSAVINVDVIPQLETLSEQLTPAQIFRVNDLVNRSKNRVFYNISIQQLISVMLSEARKVVS